MDQQQEEGQGKESNCRFALPRWWMPLLRQMPLPFQVGQQSLRAPQRGMAIGQAEGHLCLSLHFQFLPQRDLQRKK
jgi:hypothetical protein